MPIAIQKKDKVAKNVNSATKCINALETVRKMENPWKNVKSHVLRNTKDFKTQFNLLKMNHKVKNHKELQN